MSDPKLINTVTLCESCAKGQKVTYRDGDVFHFCHYSPAQIQPEKMDRWPEDVIVECDCFEPRGESMCDQPTMTDAIKAASEIVGRGDDGDPLGPYWLAKWVLQEANRKLREPLFFYHGKKTTAMSKGRTQEAKPQ